MMMDWIMTLLSLLGTLVFVTLNALIFAIVYVKVMGNSFGKANFKASKAKNDDIRFADVLGVDEAKLEAKEVVDFLRHADALEKIGAKVPKGILLVGPPGTGKTLLAKAIANEAGVPFFSLSGSDFNEVFIGVGASRIRKLYAEARKHKTAIVFIDEIDALARARNASPYGQENATTLNAFLVELDGFGREGTIITIGATNLEDSLDQALLRPGRFDRKIHVGLPSLEGRKAILEHYARRVKTEPTVDLDALARATPMMSGADLANVVNESSIMAVRAGRKRLKMADFTKAIERIGIGQIQQKTISERERRLIAYHEAGHAVVDYFSVSPKKLHKVSIIPTGKSALGYTWSVHTEDRHLTSREEFIAEIAALYGGRLAEEMVFGSNAVTGGASSDLKRIAKIAEAMVWDLGYAPGFPGAYRDLAVSEATRRELDEAVGLLMEEGRAVARTLLAQHEPQLQALAQALLEHEVLDGEQLERLLHGGAIFLPRRSASDAIDAA
ncbi:MAG: ATP-dependent metalloprotease FtsH [Cyanobacteria bacterium RYN_339]|nr:ATP-dependent metalloprotease FtsH [Cyanobacteria bacterium RYN_339]